MKYRKKPVVIEAVQFFDTSESIEELSKFIDNQNLRVSYADPINPVVKIETLEGVMNASVGDYIIKGINGEFYPCKPDIFDKTYMLAGETGELSDGYHTFNELYHHRAVLFSVICNDYSNLAWKSKKHHDGTMYDNMFIVGINTPQGQATYHYDIDPYWEYFNVPEYENAPEWDGHTASEAIERIASLGAD